MANKTLFPIHATLYLAIFLLCAATALAIANPASTYCVDLGYKSEIRTDSNGGQYGVCVFGDGNSCEEWRFFRNECGAQYKKSVSCKKAGEEVRSGKCCEGLVPIKNDVPGRYKGCTGRVGGFPVCSGCGNGVCDSRENTCNCPQDCNPCKKEGETVPLVPNPPQCCKGFKLLRPKNFPFVSVIGVCSAKCGNSVCDKDTESEYNCPQDCRPCKKEGESVLPSPGSPKCCQGLTMIKSKEYTWSGSFGICTSKCGNGVCDKDTESVFNCPADCSQCKKEGETVQVTPLKQMQCCKGLQLIRPKQPLLGVFGICTANCGNGRCEDKTENKSNCPRDCKTAYI